MDSVIKSCKNDNDIKLFEAVKVTVNEVVNGLTLGMTYQTKYMNIVISNRIDICRKIVAYAKK